MFKSKLTSAKHAVHGTSAAIAIIGALAVLPVSAHAQSAAVRSACASDYGRFCPSYAVGSPQLRSCMRGIGKRLSPGCIDALVDSGELSRKEINRRR